MRRPFILTALNLFCFAIPFANAQYWQNLANIPEKLAFPVVTVLDNKIHVMGGGGTAGATDAHYVYDPSTNKWDSLARVPYKAQQPAGAAVAGKIHYFGGGFPNSGSPVNKHYSYNPTTKSWTKETDLTAARAIHYAVGLHDTLYSIAGQGMKKLFQAYDSNSKTWATRADLPDDFFWYGAHVVTDGKIFRFGGGGFTSPVNYAHFFDPNTKVWTDLPDMPLAVHAISGSALGDSIYLVGGYASGADIDKVWIYDIKKKTYQTGPPLTLGRSYHRVVTVGNCIYSVGGGDETGVSLMRHCPGITFGISDPEEKLEQLVVKTLADRLEIVLPARLVEKQLLITLTDMNGRTVYSNNELSGGVILVPTENLSSTVYVLHVVNQKERIVKKVMITKGI